MGYGWDWKNHMAEDPKERAKYRCTGLNPWGNNPVYKSKPKDEPEDKRILIRYPDHKGYEYELVHHYGGYIIGEGVVHRVGHNKNDDEGYSYDFGIALGFESVEAMLVDWARDKGNYERVEDFLDEYFGGEETNYISESFSIKNIGEEIQTLQEILEIVQKKEKNLEGVLGVKI